MGHTQASHTYVTVGQLDLYVGLLKQEQGLSGTLLPAFGSLSPDWTALSSYSRRR